MFNNPTVLCLKHGRTYTVDEFKEEFKGKVAGDFKYSLVNIQDPIELTHNVTSNVSEHYLKKLRSQGMKAILNLRDDPLQPIFALFAKRSHTNSNSSKAAKNDSPPEKRQKIK